MKKNKQPELIAEHQGKNIYKHGRGHYVTCSESFTTLAAAKEWLNVTYRERDSEQAVVDSMAGDSESVVDYLAERIDYWQSNPYETETVVHAVVTELEHITTVGNERFGEKAGLTAGKAYITGMQWVADNDEPTWTENKHLKPLSELISVMMLAEMFMLDPMTVARHILNERRKSARRGA